MGIEQWRMLWSMNKQNKCIFLNFAWMYWSLLVQNKNDIQKKTLFPDDFDKFHFKSYTARFGRYGQYPGIHYATDKSIDTQ